MSLIRFGLRWYLGHLDVVVNARLCLQKWNHWNHAIGVVSGDSRKPRVAQEEEGWRQGSGRCTGSWQAREFCWNAGGESIGGGTWTGYGQGPRPACEEGWKSRLRGNQHAALSNYPARVIDREVSWSSGWPYVSVKVVNAELAISRGPTSAKSTPTPEANPCTERDGSVTVEREANLPLLSSVGTSRRNGHRCEHNYR